MKKIIRKILKGCSLTAAMFVFQACYGTKEDFGEYGPMNHLIFRVMDENSTPIEGILLKSRWETDNYGSGWEFEGFSDSTGVVHADVDRDNYNDRTRFEFSDRQNRFEVLDTLFTTIPDTDTIDIVLKKINHE